MSLECKQLKQSAEIKAAFLYLAITKIRSRAGDTDCISRNSALFLQKQLRSSAPNRFPLF